VVEVLATLEAAGDATVCRVVGAACGGGGAFDKTVPVPDAMAPGVPTDGDTGADAAGGATAANYL